MVPSPTVLLTLRSDAPEDRSLAERLSAWVDAFGFRACVTADPGEARSRLEHERFAALFLDSGLSAPEGQPLWRMMRISPAWRVVLMARHPRRDVWFEALQRGVVAVLPWPPQQGCVQAGLAAACGALPWRAAEGRAVGAEHRVPLPRTWTR